MQLKWFVSAALVVAVTFTSTIRQNTPLARPRSTWPCSSSTPPSAWRSSNIACTTSTSSSTRPSSTASSRRASRPCTWPSSSCRRVRGRDLPLAPGDGDRGDRVPTGPRAGEAHREPVVYGERATPYEVLSGFSEHGARPTAARTSSRGWPASWPRGPARRPTVWLHVGPRSARPRAGRRPAEPPPLRVGGDRLPEGPGRARGHTGAARQRAPRRPHRDEGAERSIRPEEDKLLQDLAAQAGLVSRTSD